MKRLSLKTYPLFFLIACSNIYLEKIYKVKLELAFLAEEVAGYMLVKWGEEENLINLSEFWMQDITKAGETVAKVILKS